MNFSLQLGKFHLSIGKGLTGDGLAFLQGADMDGNSGGAILANPYAQSAWVYCATSILAQSVSQIPFRISRVAGGEKAARRIRALRGSADPRQRQIVRRGLNEDILDGGAVVDLFNQPHPTMNRTLFWEMVVTWAALRGEYFILPLDLMDQPVDLSMRTARISRLLTLSPQMFWHVVQGYELKAWRFTGSPLTSPLPSEMLDPSQVIHSMQPNPYLYWRGLSPLTVAMAPAQTDFAGEQFQKGLWLNNADTGVIVTTDQQLTDIQQKEVLAALRERKRKAGTPDRPLFLSGGAKVEKPTLSMMDMQYLETRKFLRQEIFAIFKVPETLAGFTADLNDGGAGGSLDASKASFIESTIGSICQRLADSVDPIVKSFGPDLVGWFDIDSLPIMQAARRARWDTGTKMFAMGVPINDVNTNLDLGLPEYEWGTKSFLPFNLQEVGAMDSELPAEDPAPVPGEVEEPVTDAIQRMRKLLLGVESSMLNVECSPTVKTINVVELWKKHIAARKAAVNLFKGKTGKVLLKFRSKALAKLDEVHLQKHAGQLPAVIRGLVDIIFNALDFGAALNHELEVPIRSTLQAAGSELIAEVGADDAWKYPPQAVVEFLASRTQKIQGVGGTVRNQLNTSLEEGVTAGETHAQLADRVRQVFNDMTDGEAKRVAMTEVNMAYNAARHEAMGDVGIEYKAWLSSHGPHVREAHAEAELNYIDDPIPIDEPFIVMEEQLMYPGDDSLGASLENIINCQCVQLAAVKTGEDEKSVSYNIHGAGEMKFMKRAGKVAAVKCACEPSGPVLLGPGPESKSATPPPPPAPPQTININLTLPAAAASKKLTLERDAAGRITGAVSTEGPPD